MKQFLIKIIGKNKYLILLLIFVIAYIAYFSYLSILRYKTLYASYYDLGIMHQTVYNTYMGIKTGDFSRILELTNVDSPNQIKRMAIHNDPLLALLAPFYFIHSGPETLLVIQTAVLALGAFAVFKISQKIFEKKKHSGLFSLIFAVSYLLYPPFQRSNLFDFHAVTLATTFLLFMFYFWLVKKYRFSFIFFILSILAKEQVALTAGMFGIYCLIISKIQLPISRQILIAKLAKDKKNTIFSLSVLAVSLVWFIASVFFIIPYFRGGQHFAIVRYSELGDSPGGILFGAFTQPIYLFNHIFSNEALQYIIRILGPIGFLSIFAPIEFLMSLPELAVNLLSKEGNMRNIIYQYTAVITPFVFISGIFGLKKLIEIKKLRGIGLFIPLYVLIFSIVFAYMYGPLPYSKMEEIHPFKYPQKEAQDVALWARTLRSENFKISTTGKLAPFFTNRRYFYNFSADYPIADYIIVRLNEIYNYPEKNELIPVYEKLQKDNKYELIYKKANFEVYKKIKI